uniref:Tail fiber assembly protein n=1 Tax=Macrostomum lignano TaxID=282301 RepID=A0A1I8FN51_9PLAT
MPQLSSAGQKSGEQTRKTDFETLGLETQFYMPGSWLPLGFSGPQSPR